MHRSQYPYSKFDVSKYDFFDVNHTDKCGNRTIRSIVNRCYCSCDDCNKCFPFFFSVVLGLGIVLENKLCIFCTIFIFGPF